MYRDNVCQARVARVPCGWRFTVHGLQHGSDKLRALPRTLGEHSFMYQRHIFLVLGRAFLNATSGSEPWRRYRPAYIFFEYFSTERRPIFAIKKKTPPVLCSSATSCSASITALTQKRRVAKKSRAGFVRAGSLSYCTLRE